MPDRTLCPATDVLLSVEHIKRYFDVSDPWLTRVIERQPRRILKAVDDVTFTIRRGETFSLVGESGCGKSTVARLIVGLYRPTDGRIMFDGQNLSTLGRRDMAPFRRRMQMIFQDPYASLNPRWRVRDIIAEPLHAFGLPDGTSRIRERVGDLLTRVGLVPADWRKISPRILRWTAPTHLDRSCPVQRARISGV